MRGLLSPPTSALVRVRLHALPTVSTYLCQGKVKNRGECGRVHLRFAWQWEKHFRACGRAILPLGGTAYLAYCLALPRGYLLGAYTAGAYVLGGSRRWVDSRQVQSVGPSSPITALVRFRLNTWPAVSTYVCPSKVQTACLAYCLHPPLPG